MAMAFGRAHGARLLFIPALVISAMALTAGGALAAPPAPFTVDQSSLAFGDVSIGTTATQTFTVTTSKNKSAVIDVQSSFGPYAVTGGDCLTTYDMQVPAGTSCQVEVTFSPLTVGDWSGSLTLYNCSTWFTLGDRPRCDRTHGSLTLPYTGAGAP
jgi:Abnormal spindle-like microcephaly-assoc'd, ASPM-SPD-2-Hydin